MSKLTLLGIVAVMLLLCPAKNASCQDFDQLLNAVEEIESNLKGMIESEKASREKQIGQLQKKITAIDNESTAPGNSAEVEELMAELEVLKKELQELKDKLNANSAVLAAVNSEEVALPGPSREQVEAATGGSALLDNGLEISGFVDVSNYTDFNSEEGSFGLDQVEVDIVKSFGEQASLTADIEYVSDGAGGFTMDLEQGYLTYSIGNNQPWSFSFGKFNAPIGFELLDAPDMYQYSHAIVFDNGIPGNLTGLMISTEFPAVVDWTFYLVNGWDVNSDNNKDKTIGTRIGFTPVEAVNFGISAISGPEQDDNNSSRRTVIDFDATITPASIWTLGTELNYGVETKTMPDGSDGNWTGFLLMSNIALGERWGLTTRFDYFDDSDGLRTGTVQKIKAFAISPSVSIVDGLGGLIEFRYDVSDQEVFTDSEGEPTDNQVGVALEFTYGF